MPKQIDYSDPFINTKRRYRVHLEPLRVSGLRGGEAEVIHSVLDLAPKLRQGLETKSSAVSSVAEPHDDS